MTHTVYVDQRPVKLAPADLIQAGGEGMVFAWHKQEVIKIYHQPQMLHQNKLTAFVGQPWAVQLPQTVYAPQKLVYNDQQQVVGFVMSRLPAGFLPFKTLSNPNQCRQLNLSLVQIAHWLKEVLETLQELHQQQVVVGDLNDHNLFFNPAGLTFPSTAWLDVDSYQFDTFPCPVALQPFLDPRLYNVADFATRPVFSPASDHYAFMVLLVKSLLQLHPYGGTHHTHKSLLTRAEQKISILNGAVIYPKQARPLETLSDELLDWVQLYFEKGQRPVLNPHTLEQFAQNLHSCPQCQTPYPRQRTQCPTCKAQTPLPIPAVKRGQWQLRLLLETGGFIQNVWISHEHSFGVNRRFRAIVREGNLYSLIYAGIGGQVSEMPLFSGQPGYSFAYFDEHLVVNPPHQPHLLLLDVGGLEPTKIGLVETDLYKGQAVFACTPKYLYRLANGYIMRGNIHNGSLVEEVVGTAHPQQTQLWGSPHNDTLAGVYRIFGDYTFFMRSPNGTTREFPLHLEAGESVQELAVVFNLNGREADLFLQTIQHGRPLYKTSFHAPAEPKIRPEVCPAFVTPPAVVDEAMFVATEQGILKQKHHTQTLLLDAGRYSLNPAETIAPADVLHPHPRGLLIQKAQHLYLLEDG